MQEFQVFDWNAIGTRIKSKRVLLYWLLPLTLCVAWGLTFCVPTYYTCTTSLTTEEVYPAESYRTFTFNRPENYDLGFAPLSNSIVAQDYPEVVSSTEFICRILNTPVVTVDSGFTGTYYSYLVTQHRNSLPKACLRLLRGKSRPTEGEPLTELNPFYPKGWAAYAIGLAQEDICCDVDRHTKRITLSVDAQDPLVAAIVTQSVADNLKQFTSDYFFEKTERLYEHLQEQMAFVHAEYKEALRYGDNTYSAMLDQAYNAFQRQALVLNAQIREQQMFLTLNNVTVPADKAGPHRVLFALVMTIIVAVFVLLHICRRELFCTNPKAKD